MDNEEQVEGGDPRTPGISAATIARFIVLLLGLVNAALVMFRRGHHTDCGRNREPASRAALQRGSRALGMVERQPNHPEITRQARAMMQQPPHNVGGLLHIRPDTRQRPSPSLRCRSARYR